MIEARNLSQRNGDTPAVDDLSLRRRQASSLDFLGPNRRAKSTTPRMTIGLDAPTTRDATGIHQRLEIT